MITGNKIYFFLFLILVPVFLNAQNRTSLLNTPVKLPVRKGLISYFLTQVEQTGVLLTYNPDNIRMKRQISLSGRIKTVGELLEEVLRAESVRIKEYEGKILLISNPRLITISGIIKEQGSGEIIIGANVTEPESHSTATSNGFGFYSISLEKGTYLLNITHTGYDPVRMEVDLENGNIRKDIYMKSGLDLPELKITKSTEAQSNLNLRGDHVDLEEAGKLPSFLGEKDVVRAVQLYPGVAGNSGGSVSMFVRGGNADQNLVTLDDISIYNINHFNGMFSIFNPDVLKSVDFYRSDFPSKYGGRLSSVLNIRSRDGNMEKYHGHATIGLLYASVGLEGPIAKDKASFSFNMRRSWLDLLGAKTLEEAGLFYYFSDINLKLNYIADPNNRFYISAYLGSDAYRQKTNLIPDSTNTQKDYRSTLKWGNRLIAFRWNRIISPRLFKNTTVTFSQYTNSFDSKEPLIIDALPDKIYATVKDYGIKSDFNYYLRPDLKLNFGGGVNLNSFIFPPVFTSKESIRINTLNFNAYVEDEVKIGDHAELIAGLHYAGFKSGKTTYHTLQPRIRLSYRLDQNQVITASYSKMAQFIHQFTVNGFSFPTEFRIPSGRYIKPEISEILNLSYRLQAGKTSSFTIEAYYKEMTNLLALGSGQDIANGYFAKKIEDRLVPGKGISKGIEFSYVQQFNWLRFQMAYTLSKTTGQFKALNLGESFPLNQDFRHNFNIAANASLGKRLGISALWTYTTGQHITVPQTIHKSLDDVLGNISAPNTYIISGLNNYTLSSNYKLDLGLNLTRKFRNGHERIWSLGMYNAIANPQSRTVLTSIDNSTTHVYILEQDKLKLIPYFTFTYKF
ncbi:hypothetical protein HDF26_004410 [Pedobacter cryoconitis]|uniref:TonB-dependent receptor n=1 Tax=Pedobacter cryoconitis TaxID=188932 RepID=UPI001609F558|nr:TonB-dependent receptor [Pedobacter cryoconitis]MBB6273937.1 hypothetical protein [Pedobacter cryoconitis]